MISRARLWFLVRLSLIPVGLIGLFLSGLFPIEDYLSFNSQSLLASIAASDVASLTNEERIQNGLSPLSVNPLLTEAAQNKANDMAAHSYYAHTGPDGRTMLDWMSGAGYHYLNAGENLVIDRTTASQAVDAWMHSPDHRENILRPQFTEIGIGVAKGTYDGLDTIFVVQEFGTPYPSARVAATPKPKPAPAPAAAPPSTPAKSEPVTKPVQPIATLPSVPATAKPISVPSITQIVTPHITSLAPKKPVTPAAPINTKVAIIASTSPMTATTTAQGSTSVSYALAPEFYTPVTLSAKEEAAVSKAPADPEGAAVSPISVLILHIRAFFAHLFTKPV